ncbi:MAG: hypothetical protein L6Q35_17160, partial [Phycisphaerales bacterium]|nr:hypothetical protein [Phycisphaerales bacterium]
VFVYPNRVIRADSLCEGCGRTLHSADGNAGYHLLDRDVNGRNALVSMVSFRTVLSERALESMCPDLRQDMVLDHVEVWGQDRHQAVWKGWSWPPPVGTK